MRVTINDLSRGGSGVARLESGEVIFVPFTAPGDRVEARVTDSKKNYSQGELVQPQNPYHYRNRIQLHGNADTRELGFFRPGSREIVDLDSCAIADVRINEALPGLREQG
ncbi:TRAM domain-containing protein [bacterium]|nr:TRAM domain-containing protein [bacterium]